MDIEYVDFCRPPLIRVGDLIRSYGEGGGGGMEESLTISTYSISIETINLISAWPSAPC